jgi:hypothetical protein
MPDLVLDKTPKDVWSYSPRTITGLDVREDSLLWDIMSGRAVAITREEYLCYMAIAFGTVYTDKAIRARIGDGYGGYTDRYNALPARASTSADLYTVYVFTNNTTADFVLSKYIGGTATTLGTEAVDLSSSYFRTAMISCSGSTIKAFRVDMTTPKITATDTGRASGYFGVGASPAVDQRFRSDLIYTARLYAPASATPSALAVLELNVEGSGSPEDPYRPAFSRSPSRHPAYGDVDLDSVTWGAFEFHVDKASTVVVTITGDNPYKSGAIDRQRAKAKRVFAPPRSYDEAVALYNTLKKDYPHWLAGKENFAYQTLGLEVFDWMQNVDFYYGELLEHKTHYDQLKRVPDWEIRNRLNELIERLTKVTILTDERDKHIAKAREILSRGW